MNSSKSLSFSVRRLIAKTAFDLIAAGSEDAALIVKMNGMILRSII